MEACLIICCLLAGVYSVESVISVSGRVGGSAVIGCRYDAGYETYSKYLCRGHCPASWISDSKDIPVQTESKQTTADNGRFHLHDNTASRIFTVTITGLTAKDAGKYWCGVNTGFGSKDVYTEVELTVETINPSTTSYENSTLPSSPPTSPPFNLTSSAPHLGNITDPVLGRGQAEEEEEEEGGDEEGVSVVVVGVLCAVALVIVVLTGAVVSLAYYTHRKKKQEQPDIGPASLHSSTPTEEPNDYEEHVDMGSASGATGARASVSSIYCLAEGPRKSPSVPSLYASTAAIATKHQDAQQQQQQQQQPMDQDNNDAPIYCNAPPPQATARRNYTLHSEYIKCYITRFLQAVKKGVYCVESLIRVSGRAGGSAEIRCPYDAGYETYSKYLCRGDCTYGNKDKAVETDGWTTNVTKGRFHLHDNTASRIFTVTITGLTAKDSGKYYCGVKTGFLYHDAYTEVYLTVRDMVPSPHSTHEPAPYESHTPPSSPPNSLTAIPTSSAPVQGNTTGILSDEPVIRVTGYVGESAEIRCPYDGEFETNSKYFCRGKCSRTVFIDTKDIRVKTKKAQTTAVNGRFHLHDDTASRIFTVTITGLTAKDSGKYWCGVKTGKERMDVYTEVELTVAGMPNTATA
ncbi:uncharacterized protein LOC134458140 [Engraulis encrasicolus]|uniref:uncharacterized protein LOC134458140 n=1 Tax=Engraulis encrasicolus TaxID=184585 RepID=UPI002FD39A16